jgi:Ion channel
MSAEIREPGAGGPGRAGSSRRRRLDFEHMVEVATDRYGLVLLLLLLTYILASALPDASWSPVVLTTTAAVTVMATLAASGVGRRRRRLALLAASVAVLVAIIAAVVGGKGDGIPGAISAILLAGCLVAIVRRIASHDHVSSQTLLGAMCCYVLFGLVYTFVYAAIGKLSNEPFLSPAGNHSLSDYLFFSYTTLTTTGYGDLTPATGLGRALAMLEALMGQLFLVTVVARLVALWIPRRRAGGQDS